MVTIINTGIKPLIRRIGTGANVTFYPNQEVEITDEKLIEAIQSRKRIGDLQIKTPVGKENVGGGVKTGVRPAKRRGRPPKSKPKKEVKSKIQEKVDKALKKPKGLKKAKRAD